MNSYQLGCLEYLKFDRTETIVSWFLTDSLFQAVAYDTCDMLGCKCTKHAGQNEIMACGPVSDWDIFEPTRHDFRTMAAALGCQTPNLYWSPHFWEHRTIWSLEIGSEVKLAIQEKTENLENGPGFIFSRVTLFQLFEIWLLFFPWLCFIYFGLS